MKTFRVRETEIVARREKAQIADGIEDKRGGGGRLVRRKAKRREEQDVCILPILWGGWFLLD
jgi:hypothetical protein